MGKVKRIISVFAIAFLSLFVVSPVYAADGSFTVESAEIADKSDDVTAGTPTVSGTTITSDVTFRVLEDYVVYNITLKNGGEYDRKIVNIIDDNENNLFEFEYDNHANEIIKAGESTTLDLKVTYKNQNDDDENRDFLSTIKFNISFVELIPAPAGDDTPTGGETPAEDNTSTETPVKTEIIEIAPEVPDTSGFSGIGTSAKKDAMIVSLVIAGAGFIAAVILVIKKKGTAASKVAIASLMIIAVAPLTVQAEESSSADFEIASNYKLRDRVKLSFRTMLDGTATGESTNYYDYGDEPFANTLTGSIYGYSYQGAFNVSDNSRYDFAPLSDDVDINFVYTLDEYDITYDYDGGALEAGDENPDTYTVKTNFTLKEPVREGFEFLGWYLYGNKITAINNMVGDIELEARWRELPKTFYTITNMQQMTTELCASVVTPKTNATQFDTTGAHEGDTSYIPRRELVDLRDNNTYQITKFADGKCWMTENLALGSKTEDITLTSELSDVVEDFTLVKSDITKFRSGSQPVDATYIHDTYGTYYAPITASAGGDKAVGTESICPKGWRLPVYNGDWDTLMNKYSVSDASNSKVTTLFNFVRTGYITNGAVTINNNHIFDVIYLAPTLNTYQTSGPLDAELGGDYYVGRAYFNVSDGGSVRCLVR